MNQNDLDQRLDRAIDALNNEASPAPFEQGDPEIFSLVDTARLAKSLRDPAEPDANFATLAIDRITTDLRQSAPGNGIPPAAMPAIRTMPETRVDDDEPRGPVALLRRYAELAAILIVFLLVGGGIYVYQSVLSDDDGSPAIGGRQLIEDFDLYSVPATTDGSTYFNPIDVDTLDDLDDRQGFEFGGNVGFVLSDDGSTAVRIEYAREPEDREDILSADEVSIIVSNGLGGSERLRIHPPEHIGWPILSSDGSRLLVQGALQPDGSTPPYWYIFDTVSGEIVTTIQRDNRLGGDVLFFSADASKLYRAWIAPANSSDTPEPFRIMAYDLSSGNELDRIELPDIPAASFNLDPEISVPFAPIEPFLIPAVELSADGRSIVIAHADSNEITIVDTESLLVERTIAYRVPVAAESDVGLQMSSQKMISLSPDGQSVYLYRFLSGQQQPDDGPGLLLINLETGDVRAEAYPGERVGFVLPAPDGASVYAMTLEQDLPGTGESSQYRRLDALTLEVLAERTFDSFTMLHLVPAPTGQSDPLPSATPTPPGESESAATPHSSGGRLNPAFIEAMITPFRGVQSEVSFDIAIPTYADRFALPEEGVVLSGPPDAPSVLATFIDSSSQPPRMFSLNQRPGGFGADPDRSDHEAEDVTIQGIETTLYSRTTPGQDGTELDIHQARWEMNGITYDLASTNVDRDTFLEIAESITPLSEFEDATFATPEPADTSTIEDPVEFVLAYRQALEEQHMDTVRGMLVEQFREFDDNLLFQGAYQPVNSGSDLVPENWSVEQQAQFTVVRLNEMPVLAYVLRRGDDGEWLVDRGPVSCRYMQRHANNDADDFETLVEGVHVERLTDAHLLIGITLDRVEVHEDGTISVSIEWNFARSQPGAFPLDGLQWVSGDDSGEVEIAWATSRITNDAMEFPAPPSDADFSSLYYVTFTLLDVPDSGDLELHIPEMAVIDREGEEASLTVIVHAPVAEYPQASE